MAEIECMVLYDAFTPETVYWVYTHGALHGAMIQEFYHYVGADAGVF